MAVFGSVLTDKFTDESDIDFVVDSLLTDPIAYGEAYFDLKFELEKILERNIDLLEGKAIKNQVFKKAITDKMQILYEGLYSSKKFACY